MLALISTPTDPGLMIATVGEPQARDDEALVEVAAVSINRGELRLLAEREPGAQAGWDLAGTVVAAAADGSGPSVGMRVVGLSRQQRGWAERAAVPTSMLAELPADVSFAQASTLPIAGLTALLALEATGSVLGKRLLVTGASGGVGHFAVQLGNRAGARVTAVSSDAERRGALAELGAEDVIAEFGTVGEEFDVILDGVGGASLGAALQRVAADGIVISYAGTDTTPVSFPTRGFYYRAGGARLEALLVFHALGGYGGAARPLRRLVELVRRGDLRPQIGLETSWREFGRAAAAVVERRIVGKAVLLVD